MSNLLTQTAQLFFETAACDDLVLYINDLRAKYGGTRLTTLGTVVASLHRGRYAQLDPMILAGRFGWFGNACRHGFINDDLWHVVNLFGGQYHRVTLSSLWTYDQLTEFSMLQNKYLEQPTDLMFSYFCDGADLEKHICETVLLEKEFCLRVKAPVCGEIENETKVHSSVTGTLFSRFNSAVCSNPKAKRQKSIGSEFQKVLLANDDIIKLFETTDLHDQLLYAGYDVNPIMELVEQTKLGNDSLAVRFMFVVDRHQLDIQANTRVSYGQTVRVAAITGVLPNTWRTASTDHPIKVFIRYVEV